MVKPFRALLLLLVLLLLAVSTSAYNNGLGRLPPMGWNVRCLRS